MGPSAHDETERPYGATPPTAAPDPVLVAGEDPPRKEPAAGSAGRLLVAYLAEHTAELRAQGQAVRSGEEGGIHRMRVAARRLRSALATGRPLTDRAVTDPVCEQLRWLGEVLGADRDAQVLRAHVSALVDDEPGGLVPGAVASRLDGRLAAAQQAAHAAVLEALDGPRYARLLGVLDHLIAAPPLTERAGSRAKEVMPGLVARDVERLLRAVRSASAATGREQRDAALHEVRKKAKRVRYAAELAGPALGKPARSLVRSATQMQKTLGTQHDAVVARQRLWDYGLAAQRDGGSAFTHGRLHAQEQARADRAEAQFAHAWEKVWRRKLYRWVG